MLSTQSVKNPSHFEIALLSLFKHGKKRRRSTIGYPSTEQNGEVLETITTTPQAPESILDKPHPHVSNEEKNIIKTFSQDDRTIISYLFANTKYFPAVINFDIYQALKRFPIGTENCLWNNVTFNCLAYGSINYQMIQRTWQLFELLDENKNDKRMFSSLLYDLVRKKMQELYAHIFSKKIDKPIIFSSSGTHLCFLIRSVYKQKNVGVVLTTETGRSVKDAYTGMYPSGRNIHGKILNKEKQASGIQPAQVEEIALRHKSGKEATYTEIHTAYIAAIKKLITNGNKTIIIHFAFVSKTGFNNTHIKEFAQYITNHKQEFLKKIHAENINVIVVGDFCQFRFFTSENKNLQDPLSYCDIPLFTTSKFLCGSPFTGFLVASNEFTKKLQSTGLAKSYVDNFLAVGHFPTECPIVTDELDIPLLARFLGVFPYVNKLLKQPYKKINNHILEIQQYLLKKLQPLSKQVHSFSSDEPSIINLLFHKLNPDTIKEQMSLEIAQLYGLDNKKYGYLDLPFFFGNPVQESVHYAKGKILNEQHATIVRIGIGLRQALSWGESSGKKKVKKSIDLMVKKMEFIINKF